MVVSETTVAIDSINVRWHSGTATFWFQVTARFGQRWRTVNIEVSSADLRIIAETCRSNSDADCFVFKASIKRGRGLQYVDIPVPSTMIIAIDAAIAGRTDDDIAHAMYHYDHGIPQTCPQCPEARAAKRARLEAERDERIQAWALRLNVTPEEIRALLSECRLLDMSHDE